MIEVFTVKLRTKYFLHDPRGSSTLDNLGVNLLWY
jgi:hypothetical protein